MTSGMDHAGTSVKRTLAAILSSTISYPYAWCFFYLLSGGKIGGRMAMASSEGIRDLPDSLEWGTIGLLVVGIPILVIMGLFALMLHALQIRSAFAVIACGAVASFAAMMLAVIATDDVPRDGFLGWVDLPGIAGTICAGAVCGFIYWRIAVRPRAA